MNKQDLIIYETYCKRCKSFLHCPWLCISNDTCSGEYFKETETDEKENETD